MNEDLESGLVREIVEETSISVSVNKIFTTGDVQINEFVLNDGRKMTARIIQLGYICAHKSGEVQLSHEHVDFKWVTNEKTKSLSIISDCEKIIHNYIINPIP